MNADTSLNFHINDIPLYSYADVIAYSFKDLMEKNRGFSLTPDYAKLLNIEKYRLKEDLQQQFGATSKEILYLRLLLEVYNELLFTAKPISKKAMDLSFSEPNNLSPFFQRLSGKAPLK